MPIYDCRCNTCRRDFQVKRSMTDESPIVCPECQGTDTRKLVTGAPHIAIAWKMTYGLGHSGQIALPSVANKLRRRDRKAKRAKQLSKRRKQHEE